MKSLSYTRPIRHACFGFTNSRRLFAIVEIPTSSTDAIALNLEMVA